MIPPPATLGMLGGGQLGRYAVLAARVAGYRTIVVDPDPVAPAGAVADEHLVAAYDDPAALDRLAAACAAVSTEFENAPADALARLARDVVVSPPARAVAIAQDRIAEKGFLRDHRLPTVRWAPLTTSADLDEVAAVPLPAIVKTARLGYDGKGQIAIERAGDLAAAWHRLGGVACVVEQRVPLDHELSVIVARSADGETVAYPVAENRHRDGILDLTVVPARIADELAATAVDAALETALALDYVGVLCVELFVTGAKVLVNEIAPRPHNSGHWTLDAAVTDQFNQQVRVLTGAGLGATDLVSRGAAMANLLGDLWPARGEPDWTPVLADGEARLHLYGKAEARPGRKMGHLTVVGHGPTAAAEKALTLRARVSRSGRDVSRAGARG